MKTINYSLFFLLFIALVGCDRNGLPFSGLYGPIIIVGVIAILGERIGRALGLNFQELEEERKNKEQRIDREKRSKELDKRNEL